jgi:hypothetical protein
LSVGDAPFTSTLFPEWLLNDLLVFFDLALRLGGARPRDPIEVVSRLQGLERAILVHMKQHIQIPTSAT